MRRTLQVAVIGSAGVEEYPRGKGPRVNMLRQAETIGKLLAAFGATIITGGKGGVMEAVCRGARRQGGTTVGIVGGSLRNVSNSFVTTEIVTGTGTGGSEFQVVLSADGIIAFDGGAGTFQEIMLAYRNKRPVVILGSRFRRLTKGFVDDRKLIKFQAARLPKEAVEKLLKALQVKSAGKQ